MLCASAWHDRDVKKAIGINMSRHFAIPLRVVVGLFAAILWTVPAAAGERQEWLEIVSVEGSPSVYTRVA